LKKGKAIMKHILSFIFPGILLFGMWAGDATAQVNNSSQSSASGFMGWDANKSNAPDVTVTSIIQQVVPNHSSGMPPGLNLMLATPEGVLDVAAGPYLPQETQQALAAGQQVQVIGRVVAINGRNYLFAKQLVINGQQITIRNDHGSLVRTRKHAHTSSQTSQNGELQ
jgi:hypothetical protein